MSSNVRIFEYKSYVDYVKKRIALNKEVYGYKAQLAEAAGCQRSFLSQVLAGQTHLSAEHAIGLADFWNLPDTETDFFLNLVSLARASNKTLKGYFSKKIEKLQKDQEILGHRIVEKMTLPDMKAATFYSNWHYLAIAIVLTIPKYRAANSIAYRLGLTVDVVEKSLHELAHLGMVNQLGNEWSIAHSMIHIPNESKFNSLNHSHWRNRAVQDSLITENKSVHYTSVCSVSLDDAEKLRQLTFRFVDESRKIVGPSECEELYCLTCDWFKV